LNEFGIVTAAVSAHWLLVAVGRVYRKRRAVVLVRASMIHALVGVSIAKSSGYGDVPVMGVIGSIHNRLWKPSADDQGHQS